MAKNEMFFSPLDGRINRREGQMERNVSTLTDKWSDERVMFFASQTYQGVEVIDVAVGICHQVLWSHLQFNLDSFAQDRLSSKSDKNKIIFFKY